MRDAKHLHGSSTVRNALAVSLAAALGLPLPAAAMADPAPPPTKTWTVQNCDDSGAGSLRDAIEHHAASGDNIDVSQIACGTLTLTSGDIVIPQDELTIYGSAQRPVIIVGLPVPGTSYNTSRIFTHTGNGWLIIDNLTISNPNAQFPAADASGGCIRSTGAVYLSQTNLVNCRFRTDGAAIGGAIRVDGDLMMSASSVTGSAAINMSPAGGAITVKGGGVSVGRNLIMQDSLVSHNLLYSSSPGVLEGGGAAVTGDATIENSVISYNTLTKADGVALGAGGGVYAHAALDMSSSVVSHNRCRSIAALPPSGPDVCDGGGIWVLGRLTLTRSAIVSNAAKAKGGVALQGNGIITQSTISNSTIALNTAERGAAGLYSGQALELDHVTVASNVTQASPSAMAGGGVVAMFLMQMHNSIVSNNTAAGTEADFEGLMIGTNNLIVAPLAQTPADTIIGIDPELKPLGLYGGSVPSMLPRASSPALGAGDNRTGLQWDQRGEGFERVSGLHADIGAVEYQLPSLWLNQSQLNFPDVMVGTSSAVKTLIVANHGDGSLHFVLLSEPSPPFVQVGGTCAVPPFDLGPRDQCTLAYQFVPQQPGPAVQGLPIVTRLGGSNAITLIGTTVAPELVATPSSVAFGAVPLAATPSHASVTLSNPVAVAISVYSINMPVPPFSNDFGTCGMPPFTLPAQGSCTLGFSFAPTSDGSFTQTVTLHSAGSSLGITLSGVGDNDLIFADGFDAL